MSEFRAHTALALALTMMAALAVLFVLFWRDLLALAGAVLVLRLLAAHLGVRSRRRRASWAATVTAATSAYTAWNSRWLAPGRAARHRAFTRPDPADRQRWEEGAEL